METFVQPCNQRWCIVIVAIYNIIYFIPAYNNRYLLIRTMYVCISISIHIYIIYVYIKGVTRSLIHC